MNVNFIPFASIYFPFFIAIVFLLFLVIFRKPKMPENLSVALLLADIVCWYISDITSQLLIETPMRSFYANINLIFINLLPLGLLFFIVQFFKIDIKITKKTIFVVSIVPFALLILVLTSHYHDLLMTRYFFVGSNGEIILVTHRGIAFWIHTVYSYLISSVVVFYVIWRMYKEKGKIKISYLLIISGIIIVISGNLISLSLSEGLLIDPTLLSTSLSCITFYFAVLHSNLSRILNLSRDEIFHHLNVQIIITSENYKIIDYNNLAETWFASKNIQIKDSSLNETFDNLRKIGATTKKSLEKSKEVDVYVPDAIEPKVLSFSIHKMYDKVAKDSWNIVYLDDVTVNRVLISTLEAKAGIDALTAIPNRMAFEGAKTRLSNDIYKPLGIVLLDINGLKYTNDTLGHKYGDALLLLISGILEKAKPTRAFLGRIGGDEFIYLIPNTSEEEIKETSKTIENLLLAEQKHSFPVCLAMGANIVYDNTKTLDEGIQIADSIMYENKRKMKEKNPLRKDYKDDRMH